MSYTKEQCVERASEQPRPGYNLMSENEARELLRAHADALDEIELLKAKLGRYEREDTIKANANATLLRQVETMQAKLKVAEEALDLALMGMDEAAKGGGESFIGYALTADKLRFTLAAIRGAK